MEILLFVLELIGVVVVMGLLSALWWTWTEAGRQQRMDLLRYGRHSSRVQIALEIWNIRKVR